MGILIATIFLEDNMARHTKNYIHAYIYIKEIITTHKKCTNGFIAAFLTMDKDWK